MGKTKYSGRGMVPNNAKMYLEEEWQWDLLN